MRFIKNIKFQWWMLYAVIAYIPFIIVTFFSILTINSVNFFTFVRNGELLIGSFLLIFNSLIDGIRMNTYLNEDKKLHLAFNAIVAFLLIIAYMMVSAISHFVYYPSIWTIILIYTISLACVSMSILVCRSNEKHLKKLRAIRGIKIANS